MLVLAPEETVLLTSTKFPTETRHPMCGYNALH
jgi:hypothetical protein